MVHDNDARLPRSASVYEAVEQWLPARTWQDSPAVWVALVAAVLIAVPFMADWATRGDALTPANKHGAQAASEVQAAAPPQGATAESVAPVLDNRHTGPATTTAAPAAAAPPHLQQAEAGRQMITKCYEGGRVVYTQTGACAGSVTAVPIDTNKNVVGPGRAAVASGSR